MRFKEIGNYFLNKKDAEEKIKVIEKLFYKENVKWSNY